MDIAQARKLSTDAVKEAGSVILSHLHQKKSIIWKGKNNPTTDIDQKVEELLISKIRERFPDHRILSEECGMIDGRSPFTWIIDPLDGTINYTRGVLPFRTGLCLLKEGTPFLSAIYNPIEKELFTAEKGEGTYLNGQRVWVNKTKVLADSIILTHISATKEAQRKRTLEVLDKLAPSILHTRMIGSGLAPFGYIASGAFEAFFNIETHPWDILPGVLIVEEAGGKATDIHGNALSEKSTSIVATNGLVHDQLLSFL